MNRKTFDSKGRLLGGVIAAAVLAASCGTPDSGVDVNGAPGEISPRANVTSSRNVTLPVGTVLHLRLTNGVASDTSNVEDAVSAELTQPVVINGRDVVPAGATVTGLVREVDQSGRVKGRAYVSVGLTALRVGGRQYEMQTSGFSELAPATKGEDATKIGVGAGIGAAVGGIVGGKKGAAEGAAIGGGAGTGLVLATRGKEVRLPSGTEVTTRLTAPLTVRAAN